MSQFELLKKTIHFLEFENIPYMIVGSFVSSLYGTPRSTQDIDLVVSLVGKNIETLIQNFKPPRYYIDPDSVKKAIELNKMFNLIDTEEGDKIDFYILKNEDYENLKFQRKINENIFGLNFNILSPEDSILSKFIWSIQSGNSEKQYKDALGVIQVQMQKLDFDYLESQAKKMNVFHLLERAKTELSEDVKQDYPDL